MLSEDVLKAIELVAQTKGIILDPVYPGKVMAGLIGLIREGYFGRNALLSLSILEEPPPCFLMIEK